MSGRIAAILVAILAVLLVVAASVQPKSAGSDDAGLGRLVDLPPSRIGSLVVRSPDGTFVGVSAGSDSSGWLVNWGEGEVTRGAWPASESTRMAGLRLLSSAKVTPGPAGQVEGLSHITVVDDAGRVASEFDLGDRPLGGRVSVRMGDDGSWATVDRRIADILRPEALLAWRDTRVLPGMDASVRRIVIEGAGATVELRRVGRSWRVVSPINEPADPQAVQHLIDRLVVWQSDGLSDSDLASPGMTMRLELGSDNPNGRMVYTVRADRDPVSVCRVSIAEATRDGETQFAEATFDIDSDTSDIWDIDLSRLLLPTVLSVPASEVSGIRIGVPSRGLALEVQRTPDGWSGQSTEQIRSWLSLLAETPATEVAIGHTPAGDAGEIALLGFGELDIGSFTLSIEGDRLWVGRSRVWRAFDLSDDRRASLGL